MVDLRLFHRNPALQKHTVLDKLNSRTGRITCYLLEWTGWYNHSIAERLLGHYRLFQVYKKDPDHEFRQMPLAPAYILHYRSSHIVKYLLSRIVSFIYSIGTLGRHYLAVEIETFNRSLINENAHILQEFLEDSELDFTTAFHKAMAQLKELILSSPADHSRAIAPTMLIQVQREYHTHQNTVLSNNTYHHDLSSHIHLQPTIKEGAKGKEKGVFSKKQQLIFFDLLAQTARLEKIDFTKPTRYDDLAALLHAFTGKAKDSWIEELNNYKTKSLYEFHTQGELHQLINILINLTELLRKAGFRSAAIIADRKLLELEKHKKD